jgi:hypothetical protein
MSTYATLDEIYPNKNKGGEIIIYDYENYKEKYIRDFSKPGTSGTYKKVKVIIREVSDDSNIGKTNIKELMENNNSYTEITPVTIEDKTYHMTRVIDKIVVKNKTMYRVTETTLGIPGNLKIAKRRQQIRTPIQNKEFSYTKKESNKEPESIEDEATVELYVEDLPFDNDTFEYKGVTYKRIEVKRGGGEKTKNEKNPHQKRSQTNPKNKKKSSLIIFFMDKKEYYLHPEHFEQRALGFSQHPFFRRASAFCSSYLATFCCFRSLFTAFEYRCMVHRIFVLAGCIHSCSTRTQTL